MGGGREREHRPCSKYECQKDIHFKTQPGPVAKNATPRPPGWESNPRSRTTEAVAVSLGESSVYIFYTL